nr:hypothetical protein [Tanacetum cinerariifolium]
MRDHDITDGAVVPISGIFSSFRNTGTNDFPSNYVAHTDMVQDAVTQQLSMPRINALNQVLWNTKQDKYKARKRRNQGKWRTPGSTTPTKLYLH